MRPEMPGTARGFSRRKVVRVDERVALELAGVAPETVPRGTDQGSQAVQVARALVNRWAAACEGHGFWRWAVGANRYLRATVSGGTGAGSHGQWRESVEQRVAFELAGVALRLRRMPRGTDEGCHGSRVLKEKGMNG